MFRYYTDYRNLPKISKYIKSATIVNSSGNTVVVDFEVQAGEEQEQVRRGRHKFILFPSERVDEEVLIGERTGARMVTYFEEIDNETTRISTDSTAPPERERSSQVPVNPTTKGRARAMLSEEFEFRKRILEALEADQSRSLNAHR